MTNASSFILILVCLGLGYIIEPSFFSDSKHSPVATRVVSDEEAEAEDPTTDEGDEESVPSEPMPTITPETDSLQVDLSKITPADFPAKVTLKIAYTIEDEASGVTMQLKSGAKVKPLRLEEDQLVFQPVGLPIEGKTEVANTDFKTLAVPLMLKRLQDAVGSNDAIEGGGMDTDPAPEAEVESDPQVKTEPVVAPEPDVVPVPDTEPEVAPQADGADEADGGDLNAASVVTLMKASVADGKVSEFNAEQVVSWKAGKALEFDGKTYQTGLVVFKAETILGTQEHDAIALIENGAIVKWMWAKTKLEMR